MPIRPYLFPVTRKKKIIHAVSDEDGNVEDEEVVDQSLALNGSDVIGVASDVRDEASGVLKPKAIPSPSEPTAREIETHNLSHMPYRSW